MVGITKEYLAEKISYLESVSKLGLSLNEEYQLEAYRMLLDVMSRNIIGYTSERAAYYEVWNSGSTIFKNEPDDGDLPLMVAPDYLEKRPADDD